MRKINKKIVYLSFLIIFAIFMILISVLMSTAFMYAADLEQFITAPGTAPIEWTFIIWMIPVMAIISGVIAIYFTSHVFFRGYIKSISKKSIIGITQTEELRTRTLWLKLMVRSIILALFTMNIAQSIVSQWSIVNLIRTDIPDDLTSGGTPDAQAMFAILYLVIIPCTFILVPIWLINDIGLMEAKKLRKREIKSVNLASTPLYKMIKGYAGIGFAFNLILLLGGLFVVGGVTDAFTGIMMLISPIIIIFCVSPIVILIDLKQSNLKKRVLVKLKKLGLDKEIEVNINLRTLENPEI